MSIKNVLKYIFISWLMIGTLCLIEVPSFAAPTKSSLTQQLNQTKNKRNYFLQKKRQADLKLRN